jgi:hypothetical protein
MEKLELRSETEDPMADELFISGRPGSLKTASTLPCWAFGVVLSGRLESSKLTGTQLD